MRILAGVDKPDSGTVAHTRPDLRIGYLSQGFGLDPSLTIAVASTPTQDPGAAVVELASALAAVLIICGGVSDWLGRRGIFMVGAVLAGLWAFAIFPLIETRSPLAITMAIAVEMLLLSLMYGPQAALFAELFPVEVRYSGASLGYQVGSVFGGGFAPIIATLSCSIRARRPSQPARGSARSTNASKRCAPPDRRLPWSRRKGSRSPRGTM